YRVELKPELGSRRAQGLFQHEIQFKTGSGTGPAPTIESVTPTTLTVDGGELAVVLTHSNAPTFFLGGEVAAITSQESLGAGQVRYQLQAPKLLPGSAALTVVEADGR